MSILVENPVDRFSRDEAHVTECMKFVYCSVNKLTQINRLKIEQCEIVYSEVSGRFCCFHITVAADVVSKLVSLIDAARQK